MLRDLRVRSFGLIEELELSFEPGFNVITGETGAGKSMLMGAITLAVGGKASGDAIRTGENEASIEAVFALPGGGVRARLDEAGFESADELLVMRVLQRTGKNRVHLNGSLATLGLLETVGDHLVRIYGQGEQHSLRQTETHLAILDAFAGHDDLVATMREHHARYQAATERLRRLVQGKDATRARADLLRFQVKEIRDAGLRAGEEEELRQERQVLGSAERLLDAARDGEEALYGAERAAAQEARRIGRRLRELAEVDPRLAEVAGMVEEAANLTEDAGLRLRDYAEAIDLDPARLDQVEERLAAIERLKRKYGDSVATILVHLEAAERELSDLELGEEGLAELEKEHEEAEVAARETAARLSKSRRAAAAKLARRLGAEAGELGMPDARFDVRFAEPRSGSPPLSTTGVDDVELLFSANAGEDLRPLARIASGGELSRIMLALKSVALEESEAPTVIFDEVDSGIGGGVAEVVGSKLAAIAKRRQVLCITHLPQIAAAAESHYVVRKATAKGRTRSRAELLPPAEREEEIARMLGGTRITREVREHARQLLRR